MYLYIIYIYIYTCTIQESFPFLVKETEWRQIVSSLSGAVMERILQTHRADIASGHQRRKVPNQDLFQFDTQLANQYRNMDT